MPEMDRFRFGHRGETFRRFVPACRGQIDLGFTNKEGHGRASSEYVQVASVPVAYLLRARGSHELASLRGFGCAIVTHVLRLTAADTLESPSFLP